jgi:solute carrier family 25 phosphate transporter 23/24/25/41
MNKYIMYQDLISGAVAGVVSRTMVAPIELYRVQRQNSFIPNTTIRDVFKREGIRHLWKGNGTNCIRVVPQLAINWSLYQKVKPISESMIENKKAANFVSGVGVGVTSMFLTYPLEVSRSFLSLQSNKNKYTGIVDIFRKNSTRQLYQGVHASLIGYGLLTGLQYKGTVFDTKLLSGGICGCFSVSIMYPGDLIRRRLQLQNFDPTVPKYNGIIDCIRKIVRSEGVRGLYRGLLANYAKTFPTFAIQFYTLDKMKNFLKNEN